MANQTGLQFTVKVGAFPESTFVVASFQLDEGLNRPFNLQLELASSQPDVDFGAVLDQPCELMVWYNGELQRRVCGVVSEFAQGDSGFPPHPLQPCKSNRPSGDWGCARTPASSRRKSPMKSSAILLQEHGITDYAFALKNEHAQREYCVQYRETDLDFVNRLAAEEGLFYFHEFEAGKHRIVFADDAAALTARPRALLQPRQPLAGTRALMCASSTTARRCAPRMWNSRTTASRAPAYGLSHKKQGAELEHQRDTYQHFDYPGRYKQDPSGKAFAQHRLDALRNDAVAGSGKSNSAALLAGSALFTHRTPQRQPQQRLANRPYPPHR